MKKSSFHLSKPFPTCPDSKALPLPFALDEMAFAMWLKTLDVINDLDKCRIILGVLLTLNNSYPPDRYHMPGRTRLFFLEKLGAILDHAVKMLTLYPNTHENPIDVKSVTIEAINSEISVWGCLELGNAYSLLCQQELFQGESYYSLSEKTLLINNGLQALSKGLLFIFQTYSIPDSSLWYRCYQFYRIAKLARLTDDEFNPEAQTIEKSFKHILIFSLSNTNQFSLQEMRTVYELLGYYATHAGLLKSVPKKKFKGIPWVQLNSDAAPSITENQLNFQEGPDLIYIATVNVASKILEATYDRRSHHLPIDRLMLMRLAKTLTLNKQRKDPRSNAQGNYLGTLGFSHLFEFLSKKEISQESVNIRARAQKTNQPGELRDLDFEITAIDGKQDSTQLDELTIEKLPPHAFHVIEFTDPSAIWQNEVKPNYGINIRMLDKSVKGYGLLWTDNLIRPKIGNLIGLLHNTLTVGLIRWLAQSKETGMFMGVEILGANVTSVQVSNPGYPDIQVPAIYLPATEPLKEYASLIFNNQKDFLPNEFIFLNKNRKTIRFRQTKQLHLTSFINHVQIVRSY